MYSSTRNVVFGGVQGRNLRGVEAVFLTKKNSIYETKAGKQRPGTVLIFIFDNR
jgi:hypothetical protein